MVELFTGYKGPRSIVEVSILAVRTLTISVVLKLEILYIVSSSNLLVSGCCDCAFSPRPSCNLGLHATEQTNNPLIMFIYKVDSNLRDPVD